LKIRVRNFQPIADTTIEVEGLTVITGKTNIGKSALIRAMTGALFGATGDHFIRRGEDWCGVGITAPGMTVKWRKVRQGKTRPDLQTALEVNGTAHTKIGRDHHKLTEELGLATIETTQARLRPQVALQHDTIFLLTETETTAAEVLKLMSRTDTLVEAQKRAKKDLTDDNSLVKTRTQDRETAEKELKAMEPTKELRTKLDQLTKNTESHTRDKEKRETEKNKLARLRELNPVTLPSTPSPQEPKKQEEGLRKLKRLRELKPTQVPTVPTEANQKRTLILKEATERLLGVRVEQAQCRRNREGADEEIKVLDGKRETLRLRLKSCPTCGKPFDHKHEGDK